MSGIGNGRLEDVERGVETLGARLAALESEMAELRARTGKATRVDPPVAGPAPSARISGTPASAPAFVAPPSGLMPGRPPGSAAPGSRPLPPPPARGRLSIDIEDMLGRKVLAWVGGLAIILGAAFFVAVAIGRGWIDEPTRIVLAAVASLGLLGLGVWLRERHGATQASLAAVGSAIAALYLTITAATHLYALLPTSLALGLALAVGTLAGWLAVRWEARAIAGLGIVGALLAPPLVGAESSASSAVFLLVALAAAVGVLLWRRWDWLAVAAFLVSAPQLLDFALFSGGSQDVWGAAVSTSAYWILMIGAAVGYELRRPTAVLRPSSGLLVVGAGLVCAGAGSGALAEAGYETLAEGWIAVLAAAHGLLALSVLRSRRASRNAGLLLLTVGVGLGDIALGLFLEGPVLALAWAGSAAGFAAVARGRTGVAVDEPLARLGCGAQVTFATFHVLLFDAEPGALAVAATPSVADLGAVAGVAVSAAACARLAPETSHVWRPALDALAMAMLAYLTIQALAGGPLVAVLAGEAGLLAAAGRASHERTALAGAGAFMALAISHALTVEAPPTALRDGAESLTEASIAFVALALVLWRSTRLDIEELRQLRETFGGAAAAALLYLASVAIVSVFQPGSQDIGAELQVRQQGQLLLSAFWALTGLALLVVGLMGSRRSLRLEGFGLLSLAIGKVFLHDLSALDSLYRVLSLLALGVLLLAGALAYQRIRPNRRAASVVDPRTLG